ncbi:MAG TPA: SseB family protein [Streptosporangiaceae bacterium]
MAPEFSSAWQPANDGERRMRDVLRDGDHESYFRVLAETELIVPVAEEMVDEVLAGDTQPSWPTIELDGRTNVPVYTSAAAMRAGAGRRFQHFLKLKFAEIAEAWPDPHWWLLVNDGLPIQGQLPSWFVTQLAGGDPRPPTAGLRRPAAVFAAPLPAPPDEAADEAADETPTWAGRTVGEAEPDFADTFVPVGDVEVKLLDAVHRGDNDAFLQALADADVLLQVPEDAEFALRPGRPGFPWPTTEIGGRVSIPLFTSVERLRDMVGTAPAPYTRLPFAGVIRYWPEATTALAINPGTAIGASLPGEQIAGLAEWADQRAAQRVAARFEPQNDIEQRLFEAAGRRDRDEFFQILLGAQVVVPADPETAWGTRPAEPDFPWRPVLVNGQTTVLAFTSLRWMHDAIGPCRFLMPDFRELVSVWPDAEWTLALNPGTPVNSSFLPAQHPVASDEAAPGDAPGDAPADASPEGPAEASTAASASAAASAAASAERARGGALAPVTPPAAEFQPGNQVDEELLDAAVRGDTDAFLRVLLSATVLVPIPDDASPDIIPGDAEFRWDAALRDATTAQVYTSYERLREGTGESKYVQAAFRELITLWPDPAWTMALNPGTRIGATLRGHQVRELSEWAIRVGLNPPPPAPIAPPPTPPQPVERHPTIMQKVLPHGQVAWYLEQGYDRVGGYVHPVTDVTDLHTPAQVYQALGLLYADSPFAASDEGVYVIRWPAYCNDLYRIPFGGQAEADMSAWGEAGWVVEQPPFRGDGFASGSGGTIREYKVDSVRLPYGAEMYHLGRDRTERFVAVYDPDRLTWLRAAEENAS